MPNDYDYRAAVRSACDPVLEAEQRLTNALREAQEAALEYSRRAHDLTDAFGMERPAGLWDEGGENHKAAMECRTGNIHRVEQVMDELLKESRQRRFRIEGIAQRAAPEAQYQ